MATKKAAKKVAKKTTKSVVNRSRTHGEGIDPNSSLGRTLARRTEENLTDAMKRRRDIFVREYLYDFSAANAWRRMKAELDPEDQKAYTPTEAAERGYQLKNEPYVSMRIREAIELQEAANILSEQRVLSMAIREAELQGIGAKHAARVSAVGLLMDYLAMTSKAKTAAQQRTANPSGAGGPRGGVMVVPDVVSVDKWEGAAAEAQAKLKEEVRK